MKKLFAMILLLAFMLPALAQEVKLTCDTDWSNTPTSGIHTYVLGFDEAAGTVLVGGESHSIKTKNSGAETDNTDEYFISDASFGYTSYYEGKAQKTVTISRINGKYSRTDYPGVTGKCVRFKQEF